MAALIWVDEGPLRRELQGNLEGLSLKLRELEDSIENYFSCELPQYQAWVNHRFDKELSEISQMEKSVRVLGQHVEESVRICVEQEMKPADLFASLYPNSSKEEILENLFQEEVNFESEAASGELLSSCSKIVASDDVKDLYRKLVRCLHPDIRGNSLTECEKNIWVKAQKAYAKNDIFELQRLESCLRCGQIDGESISYSELLRQLKDFQKKHIELLAELACLSRERAWNFRTQKEASSLEKQLEQEFRNTLKDLRSRETQLQKTINSWIEKTEDCSNIKAAKPKRRAHKSQVSLF